MDGYGGSHQPCQGGCSPCPSHRPYWCCPCSDITPQVQGIVLASVSLGSTTLGAPGDPARVLLPSWTTGLALLKQWAQRGHPAQVFGSAIPVGMPLHLGCTTSARTSCTHSRHQGSVPTGPRRAASWAHPASPVPGYRHLSRQHTPTHRKHLAQVPHPSRSTSPCRVGLEEAVARPSCPSGPKGLFALCGTLCSHRAHQVPVALGGGFRVLRGEQEQGVGLAAGSGERVWSW